MKRLVHPIKDYLFLILIAILIGIITALFSYAFSKSLTYATELRRSLDFWPYLFLPIVGVVVSIFYKKYAHREERGNNLIIDEIHHPSAKIRFRMVPMVFIASILSHLFGASVGREGVGVQMGAGIADQFSVAHTKRKIILMMGMSAGFATIFSAPYAGAIFGAEVFLSGSLAFSGIIPCLISAYSGFIIISYLKLNHFNTAAFAHYDLSIAIIFYTIFLGISFGLVARTFSFSVHKIKHLSEKWIPSELYRPFLGGLLIILIFFFMHGDRYLGLGEEIIERSFIDAILPYDFLGKILSTSISAGFGFKGGEVMPLFYIGSTFANIIAKLSHFPLEFVVPLGFVGVFAGAVNVPLTGSILAVEFFGTEILPYAVIVCILSYIFSGKVGIYHSQIKRYKKF